LGVRRLRTCISWADWHRPDKLAWFDRMMTMLEGFELTVILCFTPPSRGVRGATTSPPYDYGEFVWFCEEILRRYVLREGRAAAAVEDASRECLTGRARCGISGVGAETGSTGARIA